MFFASGVGQMLLSTVLFALMNVCVKQLPRLPVLEIVLARSVVSVGLSYWAVRRAGLSLAGPENRLLLISRGTTGALALVLYFSSLQHLPLAVAAMLQYLAPIFTALVGIWAVREPVRPAQWACFGVAFAGVVLTQTDTAVLPPDAWRWALVGVTAALVSGVSYNTIRRLRGREHPLVIVFWLPLVALPFSLVGTIIHGVWPTPPEWGWLLLTGLFTQGAQITMTRAYQAEELSKIAPLNYLGLLYAVALGAFFFHEHLSRTMLAGVGLVLIGVGANLAVKARADKQAAVIPLD